MRLTKLFTEFFESEKAGGLILIACTVISLLLTNSPLQIQYLNLWHFSFAGHPIEYWINDGLMAIFFLLVGLELEREIYAGELSTIKKASLPVVAALGGMFVPAGIFFLFNVGTPTLSGVGIPMATDIAFAIGVLSLLGNKVPAALKVMLIAFAVIDDLGAILIIAIFYTNQLDYANLGIALSVFALLLLLNRLKVRNLIPYLIGGIIMWYFMLNSGVHATITGVLLAFAIPFGKGDEKSTSYILQHHLHKPVAFFILPLFALANTCIVINSDWYVELAAPNSLGILAGLIIGKPIGVLLFCFVAVSFGICVLPSGLKWRHIAGAGILGGIGFTMSIFITLLAFDNVEWINGSKMAILLASFVAGTVGFLWLNKSLGQNLKITLKE